MQGQTRGEVGTAWDQRQDAPATDPEPTQSRPTDRGQWVDDEFMREGQEEQGRQIPLLTRGGRRADAPRINRFRVFRRGDTKRVDMLMRSSTEHLEQVLQHGAASRHQANDEEFTRKWQEERGSQIPPSVAHQFDGLLEASSQIGRLRLLRQMALVNSDVEPIPATWMR